MDVIVIGCGASGIAALRKLHDAGLKVLGLEAADRIGGRINTVEFGKSTVDLGAAWCHGEKENAVFELAEPLDLLGRPNSQTKYYVLSNGDLAPTEISDRILEELHNQVSKAEKNNSKSVLECVHEALTTNETLKKASKLSKYITESYSRSQHLGGHDDPKNGKSLKGLTKNLICEGEFMLNWKERGYKSILDVLLNEYPDPSKKISAQILLNKEVESIKWGASQPPNTTNPLVQVKCKDGSLYAAKSVIVTLSVGVLKERYSDLFDPVLPKEKVNCIKNLHVCLLNKIYIEFTEPWWPTTHAVFTILWRDEEKSNYIGEDEWITHIFSLETINHQPNVLLAWTTGKGAELMEKLSLEKVTAGVKKLCDQVLENFDVTPVKSILRSQWGINPLTRCAYAYRSVASEENGASAELLSEPLLHGNDFPIVCFAGEATSHSRHSAVHGAIEAGFREADRLIETFKNSKN